MSKTLIAYYSLTGNVKLLAKTAAEMIEADVEEIVDKSKWTGPVGFINRFHRTIIKGDTKLEAPKYNPKDYDKRQFYLQCRWL